MNNDFQEILTFPVAACDTMNKRHNVVKAHNIIYRPEVKVQIEADSGHSSTVVLHRDGDVVKSIEVVCACGKPTIISLEYDND